ncbi:MAG: L,D-transpeptidase [Sandaracinaceae bacterium]|nr:L,D-transpeptidase [Sandaracinaceae bacterium]
MRLATAIACAFVAACLCTLAATRAQELPPLPAGARSIEVMDEGAYVLSSPHANGTRRGTLKMGAHLAFVGRVVGDGCTTGAWFALQGGGFVCGRNVRLSTHPPIATSDAPRVQSAMPYEYAFVRVDGTRGFAHPHDAESDDYLEAYGEGFGLAIMSHSEYAGEGYARTYKGVYVPEDSLHYVRGSEFAGERITDALHIAWVVRATANILERSRGRVLRRARRLDPLLLTPDANGAALQLAEGGFVAARDVARATLHARPEEVGDGEKWVDINVTSQTLVAYEGERPIFATPVSTGRRGAATATPLGVHRVWAKLSTSDMDDLEREDVERNYAMQAVPWVQYFEHSNGLHAAFWHDRFGERHSHGCVNLSPSDAHFLFQWSTPVLPPGWSAILPTAQERSLVVSVHE